MKVKIEIEGTAEEFQDMFVPSDKQAEFLEVTYNAYAEAMRRLVLKQIDPYNFTGIRDDDR